MGIEKPSPYTVVRQLEQKVVAVLSSMDIHDMEARSRVLTKALKAQLVDVRLDIRDYEYAETRAEQTRHSQNVRIRLEALRQHILAASEYGLFNAVDVVHFSTIIDGLLEELV